MSDHAYLIASARAIADRHDCSHPGHMLDMAAAIEALVRERDEARAYGTEVRLREKAAEDARVSAVDRAAKAEAERDAARALLQGVRDWLVDDRLSTWRYMEESGFYQDRDDCVARIDAALKEGKG